MVRAGRNARWTRDFLEQGIVALGWFRIGDATTYKTKADLIARFKQAYPDYTDAQLMVAASQIFRFINKLRIGDRIMTYNSAQRTYHLGTITTEARHDPKSLVEEKSIFRRVDWTAEIGRDVLSQGSRNRLGSVLTLFAVPPTVVQEIDAQLAGIPVIPSVELPDDEVAERFAEADDLSERAIEQITDRISRLDWDQMQELVAGLLRAMGYKTTVSPAGSDRGKDIFASPDGFGFEQPRIFVEVKHRPGQRMGSQEVRTFIGGRQKDDRCLFVSTGGFTQEARYEAERSSTPLTLMTLDELARAVVDNYERFDETGRSLIPLKRVYWPL